MRKKKKKARPRITRQRGELSALKSFNIKEKRHVYIDCVCINRATSQGGREEQARARASKRERESREAGKEQEQGTKGKNSGYDVASRYFDRLAATRTHCVKLISIFGGGRENAREEFRTRDTRNSEVKARRARACEDSGSEKRRRSESETAGSRRARRG